VVDGDGNTLGVQALWQSAQRYGGDQVLVGRADAAGMAAGQVQGAPYTRGAGGKRSRAVSGGLRHAVGGPAAPPGAGGGGAEAGARVRVEGVVGLGDFAAVERLLQSIPGVHRAEVAEVDAGSATFEVQMRGGAGALEHELTASPRLVRSGSGAALVYRYRPQ